MVLQVRQRAEGAGRCRAPSCTGETLADAVKRSLRDKAGVRGLQPRQLHVFDDPDRDDRGWVLSVAHVDVVQPEQPGVAFTADTRLVPVDTRGGCPTTTPTSSRGPSSTSGPATATSPTPTDCSATSSRCASYGSPTRPSPDRSCSATRSAAPWNRNSSRPAP